MPGFPVDHQLLEPAQTHVHRGGDTIQPAHLLSSPFPPTCNLSHSRVFLAPSRPSVPMWRVAMPRSSKQNKMKTDTLLG